MKALVVATGLVLLLLTGCSTGKRSFEQTPSYAPDQPTRTRLAQAVQKLGNPGDGRSGVKLIGNGEEALAARLALASSAEQTIDAQYYLLHNDLTGQVFAWSLLEAADRGVRVRLLLDDMDTGSYDAATAALDSHKNIEIRLFNPFCNPAAASDGVAETVLKTEGQSGYRQGTGGDPDACRIGGEQDEEGEQGDPEGQPQERAEAAQLIDLVYELQAAGPGIDG